MTEMSGAGFGAAEADAGGGPGDGGAENKASPQESQDRTAADRQAGPEPAAENAREPAGSEQGPEAETSPGPGAGVGESGERGPAEPPNADPAAAADTQPAGQQDTTGAAATAEPGEPGDLGPTDQTGPATAEQAGPAEHEDPATGERQNLAGAQEPPAEPGELGPAQGAEQSPASASDSQEQPPREQQEPEQPPREQRFQEQQTHEYGQEQPPEPQTAAQSPAAETGAPEVSPALDAQDSPPSEAPETGTGASRSSEAADARRGQADRTRADVPPLYPGDYIVSSESPYKVSGPHESPESWIDSVNPDKNAPGRDNNCAECTRASQRTWEGDPTRAAAMSDPNAGGEPVNRMSDWAGQRPQPASMTEIGQRLTDLGPGSSAIVGFDYGPLGDGHWFNAVNDAGTVKAVDGQSGEREPWPPSAQGLGFDESVMYYSDVIYFDANGKVVR